MQFVIISGMSGAGKSRAASDLEDLGFYCVDNMPAEMIPQFAQLCLATKGRYEKVALVTDVRASMTFDALFQALQKLDEMHLQYSIYYIEASTEVIIKRYKETRRVHPLAPHGRISQGIAEERKRLASLRQKADFIIDTSNLKPKQLKEILVKRYAITDSKKSMTVTVVSFGFKHGMPIDADIVEDVRFLPNPYYIEEYRHKSGRVPCVRDYVESFPITQTYKEKWFDMIDFLLPNYEREGKSQLVIAVGCTGGMHRSVCMAEAMYKHLRDNGVDVSIEHRDIQKNDVEEDAPGYEGEA